MLKIIDLKTLSANFVLISIAAFLFLGGTTLVQSKKALKIVAVVNEQIVTDFDLQSRITLKLLAARLPNNLNVRQRISPRVLNELIQERLKLQEAKRRNISVSQGQVDTAIEQVANKNKMSKIQMLKIIKSNNINILGFERQIRAELAWGEIIGKALRRSNINYKEYVDNQIKIIKSKKGKSQFLIHEIYIGGGATKLSRNGESLALKLYNQIRRGTPFERVARSFSESASAARSGNLGWINEDQLTREQEYAISEQPNGGLSKPIKGAEGFYIFLLKNKRATIDLAKGEISVSLQQIFLPLSPSSSIQEKEAQSSLALSIADSARNCKDMKQIGRELGSNSFNELKNVKISRLNTNIRPIAEKLELQKASDPIRMSSGILVLMVCERNSSSEEVKLRQKLMDSYSQIQAASISKRMLRNLKRSAFIEVRQ